MRKISSEKLKQQEAVSFKPIGSGLRASEERLKEQAKTKIDALKLAQYQHEKASDIKISGLSNKAQFEENIILKEQQKLEASARQTRWDAVVKHGDTHVNYLKGLAAEKQKEADYYYEMTPKWSKVAGQVARGIYDLAEAFETRALNKAYDQKGLYDYADTEFFKAREKHYESWLKQHKKIDSPDEWQTFLAQNTGADNHAYAQGQLKNLQKNRNYHNTNFRSFILKRDEEKYKQLKKEGRVDEFEPSWTPSKVEDLYENQGHIHLKYLGINPNSPGGRAILRQWRSWGVTESNRLTNVQAVNNTRTSLNNLIPLIKDADTVEEKRIHFASMVKTIQLGTFSDTKGGFTFGVEGGNIAEAQQKAIEYYLTVNGNDFENENELAEFVNKFAVDSGDELKGDKAKLFTDRHLARWESIKLTWGRYNEAQKKIKNAQTIAEDKTLIEEHDLRYKNHLNKLNPDHKDYDKNYQVTDKEFYVKEIRSLETQTKGSIVSKNHVYRNAGIGIVARDHAQVWATIQELVYINGDFKTAAKYFSAQDPSVRKALKGQFEFLNSISAANYQDGGKSDIAALIQTSTSLHKGGETFIVGGKNLSSSGRQSVNNWVGNVVVRYNSLLLPDKSNAKEAMQKAIALETTLYNEGYNPKEPKKFVPNNPYSRIMSFYINPVDGKTRVPQFIYKEFAPSIDAESEALLKEELSLHNEMNNARRELRDLTLVEFSPESVNLLTKFNYVNYDAWLADTRFVSPNKVDKLRQLAIKLQAGEIIGDDLSMAMPQNVSVLARQTGKSDVEVLNDLLSRWNPKGEENVRFAPDGQDASILRNGEWVPSDNPFNTVGRDLVNTAISYGKLPMSPVVRSRLEKGIEYSDYWALETGVTKTNNQYLGDPESLYKFYDSSALKSLTTAEVMAAFPIRGLKGIETWRYKGSLYTENPYKPKPKSKKRR